mmetsp:Transcript_32176/g.44110  ORF Transcript_32176/g.44110 Transcript_32176/m.44110 type:complete len:360 (+) Transcript_32176:62-1141(+)|eukprot:CAMPEP_0201489696 /NCGR_PEP_ID=MMETSP0151_2-20130828/23360_1 /ASSEMBLY_ACC=CAM_ASM_000257 /TAXON_ID=200890 /ORGANISM="Paramoeba atlantica, Strain 621/1 / CCAP 1560/9" /LENGTH=359 /DNA_ID=CAMNT_0047875377 /DNA_START=59 /DNA_END=1138 /DNA_ORIENTATION=+
MRLDCLFSLFFLFCLVSVQGEQSTRGLHIKNNTIYNVYNEPIRLRGTSQSGTEYACVQGWGIFDAPTDDTAIEAIKSWNINIVRLPVNEDCWLSLNGVKPQYSGSTYISAIVEYVERLISYNLAVIIDLQWTAPGTELATKQAPMADKDHSIDFWESAAQTFSVYDSVLFDLFNEPFIDDDRDTTPAWVCWQNGGSEANGTCPGVDFEAAGMQDLVDAVRSTNATNIVLAGGLQYSDSLSQWLTYMPTDPLQQLGASWHSYDFNLCTNQECWDSTVRPVAEVVPVVVTEFGESDCDTIYVNPLMDWMDSLSLSYLGWTWNTWDCDTGPALIKDYDGTPTNYGLGLYDRLLNSTNSTFLR